jgi:hypothetical protein
MKEPTMENGQEKFLGDLEQYMPEMEKKIRKLLKQKIEFQLQNDGDNAKDYLIEDTAYLIEDALDNEQGERLEEFTGLEFEGIYNKLREMGVDDVIEIYIAEKLQRKLSSEKAFLTKMQERIKPGIKTVFFDLDETLVSKVCDMIMKNSIDLLRPAGEIILKKLKEKGIKIGILTTRSSEYIPEQIASYIDDKVIGKDENEQYQEKCFQKFGLAETPTDAKECFAKVSGNDVLIVDDAPYAKDYENCVHVNDEIKFYL